jgi:predicted RecA/RadA family phage recombinase
MKALNTIRNHGRNLVMASMLAVAVMGIPAAMSVHAMDNENNGEAATCWYAGQQYSEGAKITLPDGTVQTCQHDGTWAMKVHFHRPIAPISGVLALP